jgi:hypothetical protein
MPTNKQQLVALQLDLDTRSAERASKKFETVVQSSTRRTEKTFDAVQKSQFQAVSKFFASVTKGRQMVTDLDKQQKVAAKLYQKTMRQTKDDYDAIQKKIKKTERALHNLVLVERSGSVTDMEAHRKKVQQQKEKLRGLDDQRAAITKLRKNRLDSVDKLMDAKTKAQEKFGLNTEELVKAAIDAGGELVEPFKAMLDRDWQTAMKSGAKLLGTGLDIAIKGAGKGLTEVLHKPGSSLQRMGGKLQAKGKGMGGIAGAGVGKLGGAMSTLGSATKGIGPLLQSLAKIGPLVGVLGGAIVGLVQMFLDADAHIKEFNKSVMESASTTGALGRNMGNVVMASQEMEADMAKLRDEAFTLDNVMRGLSKEDFTTVSAALGQQGLSLHTIANEFSRAQGAGEAYAKVFASNTHMAVAYARQMNVPLQEIASFQGEMMTELGMSAGNVVDSFQAMERGAAEAGVSSQRFFTMIKGVSSDLALYNTRLDETIHIMTLLSKVMSPRNAAKFMQTATNALKGMGRVQLLQTNMLGGSKGGEVVEKELARKSAGVASEIERNGGKKGLTRDDLMKKSYDDLLEGVADEQKGALREAISEMRMDSTANKKGVFGSSMAMGNLGAGASLQVLKDSLNITGKGKLRDRVGDLGSEMLADKQGIDRKMFRSLAQFEEAIDDQRDWLKKNQGTDAGQAALKKAGLKPEDIDSADYDDILSSMGDDAQKQVKGITDTRDAAQKQLDMTESFNAKIAAFFGWFQTTFYNLIVGMFDALSSLPGVGDGGKGRSLSAAYKTKNQEIISAVEGAKGGKEDVVKRLLGTGAGKTLTGSLEALPKQIADLAAKEQATAAGGDVAGAQAIGKQKDALIDQQRAGRKAIDDQLAGGSDDPMVKVNRLLAAAKSAGLDPDAVSTLDTQLRAQGAANGNADEVDINKAGLTDEQIGKIYAQAAGQLDPRQLLAALSGAGVAGVASPQAPGGSPAATGLPPAALAAPSAAQPSSPVARTAQAAQTTADHAEVQTEQQEKVVGTLGEVEKILRQKGIVFDKTQWKSRIQDQLDKGMLDSLRTALYEFYLYKDVAQGDVQKAMMGGLKPAELGPMLAEQFGKGVGPQQALASYQKNAEGGVVTGVSGGVAQVRRLPSGEGLASVGPGERIVPAGGGGGDSRRIEVILSLKGDLGKIIDARASDVFARNSALARLR